MAVAAVFTAGAGSALALGQEHAARAPSPLSAGRPGRGGISGVVSGAWAASDDSAGPSVTHPTSGTTAPAVAPSRRMATRPVPAGLSVPAGGAPVSAGEDPAAPPSSGAQPGRSTISALPTPTSADLPEVSPAGATVSPDAVVMMSSPLTREELGALSKLRGVSRVETVDTGTVSLDGAQVVAFGVDPSSFRDFTPAASASSDELWRYLAGGALVSSYDMAHDRSLVLGSTQSVTPGATSPDSTVRGWLGAFASIGLPGVDLLIDHHHSSALGLIPDSGVVVAAPGLAGSTLQSELQSALPGGAVELLHPDQLPSVLTGDSITSTTRQEILAAALSRVGLPYVWGGDGPDVFDCSGLVQWAYRQAGILMPRVAAEQFLTGDHIPLADAQPGDLLFWTYDPSDPGYVDHTAIYLGHGMMVVAPHTGTDVQVAPVPTEDFAGAVEVVLQK